MTQLITIIVWTFIGFLFGGPIGAIIGFIGYWIVALILIPIMEAVIKILES